MTHPQPRNVEPEPSDDGLTGRLPRRLPALGLPAPREGRRGGALLSILIHIAIILALLAPAWALHTDPNLVAKEQGAGGKGPSGGGGGGTLGTGGLVPEKLTFVRVAPMVSPPQPVPAIPPVTPPPVVQPKPVVTPPKPEPPKVQAPAPQVQPATPATATPAPTAGSGGGTGADGTAGSGPGTGGGVGAGTGTGRGSGTGPGTGGGTQENYPPQPTAMFIPPLPAPGKVHGFQLIAQFDVDTTGKVLKWSFTPTPDGGYNRELEQVLKSLRFRPGTKPDGTPIRMIAQITYSF